MADMKRIPVKQTGFTVREIDTEMILVGEKGNVLHSLNETGSFIWSRIDGAIDMDGLLELVCREYDVPQEAALADLVSFIGTLAEKGIIALRQ